MLIIRLCLKGSSFLILFSPRLLLWTEKLIVFVNRNGEVKNNRKKCRM